MHGERASNKRNWMGRDYWGRRLGNTFCSSYRSTAHRDRESHKRLTHRLERRTARAAMKLSDFACYSLYIGWALSMVYVAFFA